MLDCMKPNKGEQLVKHYLESQGYAVIDVSKNKEYWIQDIDFLAIRGQQTIKIEVKYDSWIHKTRNLFIELMSDIDANKGGWIDFCKADYIYYVDAVGQVCYVIALDAIKDYLKRYSYQVKECVDRDSQGRIYKRSTGALINVDKMKELYNMKIIDFGS